MLHWFMKLTRGKSRRPNNKGVERNTGRRLWNCTLEPLERREYLSPAAPVVTGFSSDSGVTGDRITSDNSLLVTGTADPGNSVNVFFNSVLQGNTVAAADRSWSLLANAKPDGIYSITATAQDSGGATSSASAAFAVTIDTIAPIAPSISGFVGDTGVVGDGVTSDTTLTITGSAEAGSRIRLLIDGVGSATTTTAANGTWSVAAPALAEGTHTLSATAQDAAGNISAASTGFDITVDLTAPAAPTIGGFTADSGVAGDSITNDNTPSLAGTAEPFSSVTVFFSGVSQGTAVAAADGAWSFTAAPLDGLYNVTATAQDAAGKRAVRPWHSL
jgi:hypothetical protein